jgi:hypothetical protein
MPRAALIAAQASWAGKPWASRRPAATSDHRPMPYPAVDNNVTAAR